MQREGRQASCNVFRGRSTPCRSQFFDGHVQHSSRDEGGRQVRRLRNCRTEPETRTESTYQLVGFCTKAHEFAINTSLGLWSRSRQLPDTVPLCRHLISICRRRYEHLAPSSAGTHSSPGRVSSTNSPRTASALRKTPVLACWVVGRHAWMGSRSPEAIEGSPFDRLSTHSAGLRLRRQTRLLPSLQASMMTVVQLPPRCRFDVHFKLALNIISQCNRNCAPCRERREADLLSLSYRLYAVPALSRRLEICYRFIPKVSSMEAPRRPRPDVPSERRRCLPPSFACKMLGDCAHSPDANTGSKQ
jgi:hypothetical protein